MSGTPTVLLHLSDIHFRHNRSGTPHDLDQDLRDKVEKASLELRQQLRAIHGIIVSGDIAFSGHRDEYETATNWLQRLCDLLKCDHDKVWTVPGNHDVQRDIIRKSNNLQLLHRELRNGAANTLDDRLRQYLFDDEEAAAMLARPLQNYNVFAARFGCEIKEKQMYWEHNLILNDTSTLRLRGANSTIVSDEYDHRQNARLVVGAAQSLVRQQDGVECLFICHHPPDWLVDQDNIDDHLRMRTRMQLFGHKHSARMYRIGDSLRIAAGATHPDRGEPEWEPAFNVISVFVKNEGGQRSMEIDVYPRVWSKRDLCFKPDLSEDKTENHHWSFRLSPWDSPTVPGNSPMVVETAESLQEAAATSILETLSTATGGRLVNPARQLTYRFMSLPYQLKVEVAQELHLIENEDAELKDAERYQAYFRRAKERKLLARLWDVVERKHGSTQIENPFVGQ